MEYVGTKCHIFFSSLLHRMLSFYKFPGLLSQRDSRRGIVIEMVACIEQSGFLSIVKRNFDTDVRRNVKQFTEVGYQHRFGKCHDL